MGDKKIAALFGILYPPIRTTYGCILFHIVSVAMLVHLDLHRNKTELVIYNPIFMLCGRINKCIHVNYVCVAFHQVSA